MGLNVLSQSDCIVFWSTISPEKINELAKLMNYPDFLHTDTNSHKLKVNKKWAC